MNFTSKFNTILFIAFAGCMVTSVSLAEKKPADTPNQEKQIQQLDAEKKERWLKSQTSTLNFEPEPPKNEIIKQGDLSAKSPTSIYSDHKLYRVTLHSKTFPLPLQKIHSWVVHIETAEGKPVEKATVFIHGGMPEHRHGFPVKPRVKKYLGNGNYLISGVKFSMVGNWEMRINIKEQQHRDRAVFWFPVK